MKKTYIVFLLDKSGSMRSDIDVTIEGFNQQVSILKENKEAGGDTRASLYTFGGDGIPSNQGMTGTGAVSPLIMALTQKSGHTSHGIVQVVNNESPDKMPLLDTLTYVPDGGTPLYDAFGTAIDSLLLQSDINHEDTAVLVVAFTDGEENTSRKYSAKDIATKVDTLTKTGRWTFSLIGPKGGVETVGDLLAIKKSNRVGFNPTLRSEKHQVFGLMANATSVYMDARSVGSKSVDNLYNTK